MAAKARPQMGKPKIRGFMARSANTMVLLYQRRRRETFVLRYTYADKTGGARNKLKVGSRFTGRFYPSRCDLSPDGKHFVYFVMGGAQSHYPKQLYCWTAMCRPPLLKASFLLPHDDTWGGGGVFLNDKTVVIEGGMYDDAPKLESLHRSNVDGVDVLVESGYVSLAPPRKVPKYVDSGWRATNPLTRMVSDIVWTKSAKRAKLRVRERDRQGKQYPGDYDRWEYVLHGRSGKATFLDELMAQATWADFDRQGRLVLGIGHTLQIFNSPREGMKEKPNRILDLEEATEEV